MQNLNDFIIANLGLFSFGLLATTLILFVFLFIKQKNSNIKEILLQSQGELSGRIAALNESNLQEQNRLFAALNEQKTAVLKIMDERLLAVTKSVGDGLQQSTAKTNQTLTDLRERLAKIDVAQQKISSLSEQVVSLQEVLSNKQSRGAFGEIQLNDLVSSILPPSAYSFQTTLSNGKKADCLLKLPNPPGAIVVDAKFPLESYQELRKAINDRERIEAERFFKSSVIKHIKDISEKYILSGETAESALMFLPSEAIYAELHANFVDVVETSYKAKVWIVSPTTLMATLNTIRAILKDAPILIFDEATSSLDSESEKYIQGSLKTLMKNKTVIAVAHRLSTLREMDRIIVLEEGRIIEQGTHLGLLRKKGRYAKLFKMQSDGYIQNT